MVISVQKKIYRLRRHTNAHELSVSYLINYFLSLLKINLYVIIRIYKKNLASGTIREPGIYESNVFLLLELLFYESLDVLVGSIVEQSAFFPVSSRIGLLEHLDAVVDGAAARSGEGDDGLAFEFTSGEIELISQTEII